MVGIATFGVRAKVAISTTISAYPWNTSSAGFVGLPSLSGWLKRAHRDPLIGVGTAPLEDQMFRSALFEQLGEDRLEVAVTSDICSRNDSHAMRLDNEAVDTIKRARCIERRRRQYYSSPTAARPRTKLPSGKLGWLWLSRNWR